jgi:hypothetical protein
MKETRKRLFISKKTGAKEREKLIRLAVENECNTLVFPLDDIVFRNNVKLKYMKLVKHYSINVEAGGCDFSLFLPRKLFFFNRSLFRMERGKRKISHHFCTTNPKVIEIIAENAHSLFTRAMQVVTTPRIFHLQPDKGHQNTWCACPACRAFRPAEQYLIAINTAADALAKLDPKALVAYINFDTEPESEGIPARKNTMAIEVIGKPG